MIKKLFLAIAALAASVNIAFAQVDVNKADAAALDSVKGVGPAMSKTIIDERAKGEFKDWADFQKRVKGVGEKRAGCVAAQVVLNQSHDFHEGIVDEQQLAGDVLLEGRGQVLHVSLGLLESLAIALPEVDGEKRHKQRDEAGGEGIGAMARPPAAQIMRQYVAHLVRP